MRISDWSSDVCSSDLVSLHAPNDELRTELVPLNKKYPIAELMAACERYVKRKPRSSITFEYTLMKGVNDQPRHARELARRSEGRRGGKEGVSTCRSRWATYP